MKWELILGLGARHPAALQRDDVLGGGKGAGTACIYVSRSCLDRSV